MDNSTNNPIAFKTFFEKKLSKTWTHLDSSPSDGTAIDSPDFK